MWAVNILRLIRGIVGDMSCEAAVQQYSDSRLLSLATIAAYQVSYDVSLDTDYSINIATNTITPDPFMNNDKAFNILTAYKASMILLNSEIKAKAASSVSIKDGPSSISLAGMGRELQAAAKIVSDLYASLEYDYKRNKSSESFYGIISPYYVSSYLVENYHILDEEGEIRWQ
jgi:hypothetical protein